MPETVCSKGFWAIGIFASPGITPNYNTTAGKGSLSGTAFTAGFTGAYRFNEHLQLSSGIERSAYNYTIRFKDPKEVVDRQQQYYIDVPLLLTLGKTFPAVGKQNWCYVQLGFSWSHCYAANYRLEYVDQLYPERSGGNLGDFRKNMYRIILGAGIQFRITENIHLVGGIRLSSGLQDNIAEDPQVIRFEPGSLSVAACSVGLQYSFRKKQQ